MSQMFLYPRFPDFRFTVTSSATVEDRSIIVGADGHHHTFGWISSSIQRLKDLNERPMLHFAGQVILRVEFK